MKRTSSRAVLICCLSLLWGSLCFAGGGKVTYPDGRPVPDAKVNVHLQDSDRYTLTTDANGLFTLPELDFEKAFVQIKAPDGQEYATVNLPAKVFERGVLSVVLQRK